MTETARKKKLIEVALPLEEELAPDAPQVHLFGRVMAKRGPFLVIRTPYGDAQALVRKEVLEEDAAGKIMPGIGVISTECELAPDQILQQIAEARRLNLPGYVLFKLDQVLIDRALPYLKLAQ